MTKKEYSLDNVVSVIEELWPLKGASSWDNSGLQIGNRAHPVRKILLCVDAVTETVQEAIHGEYDLIISHHPLLFKTVKTLDSGSYHGSVVVPLIENRCGLYAAHTSADVVMTGTSRALAEHLNLNAQEVLIPSADNTEEGLGIVGSLPREHTLQELASTLADILPVTAGGLRVAGDANQTISTIALCAGAGDSLLDLEAVRNADVYITSDLRHHPALEAKQHLNHGHGSALIDISHWAAESLWLEYAQQELQERLDNVSIDISFVNTDPWDFLVIQSES